MMQLKDEPLYNLASVLCHSTASPDLCSQTQKAYKFVLGN